MKTPDFAKPKTSYRKLYPFLKAEAIYDMTAFRRSPRKSSRIAKRLRRLSAHPQRLIPKLNDEEYCNPMLTLIHQTIAMLNKMIDNIKEDFVRNGGIKEQMFRARTSYRGK